MENNNRVPVVSREGIPLMPTTCKRARKWIEAGKAVKCWNKKLSVFYIKLTFEPSGYETQKISTGIDPGSSFSGLAVQSKEATHLGLHLELPRKDISKKLENRSVLRRARRGRRINRNPTFKERNHREKRFKNRKSLGMPPSMEANKFFETSCLIEILKIFPISDVVYEVVKAKNLEKGNAFSFVMVGQKIQLKRLTDLSVLFGFKLKTQYGFDTSNLRQYLHLPKNKDNKAVLEPETHVTDAISLAASAFMEYKILSLNSRGWKGSIKTTNFSFRCLTRSSTKFNYRKLHLEMPGKKGVRKVQGGSILVPGSKIKRGDLIAYSDKKKGIIMGYASGSRINNISKKGNKSYSISISGMHKDKWKRYERYSIKKLTLLQKNTGVVVLKSIENASY